MTRRGSYVRGEDHHEGKLKTWQVDEIYDDPASQRSIALKYGISPAMVNHIKKGTRWQHRREPDELGERQTWTKKK